MNIHSATVLAGRNGSFNGNRGAENAYSPASVTGRDIAHSHRTASARAGLAAQLVLGEVKLIKPTITQVASIARISIPYVRLGLELTQGTRTHLAAGSPSPKRQGATVSWPLGSPPQRKRRPHLASPLASTRSGTRSSPLRSNNPWPVRAQSAAGLFSAASARMPAPLLFGVPFYDQPSSS